ncbi:Glycine/serine hydroxymethyltransferase, partial [Pseudoloma neurophilia]
MTTAEKNKKKSFQCLKDADPEMYMLCIKEKERQKHSVELIASESYVTESVLQVSASLTHNKYSEGYPGARYYSGTGVIDEIELLCQKRALELYELDPEKWGVNVQPYSGSIANFQVYNGLLQPNGKIMGMDLFSGGHLSHGFKLNDKIKVSVTSKYFDSFPYKIEADGSIDYDKLEKQFVECKAEILILGASAYPEDFDYKKARKIADKNKAYLMCDMAHISGLVAYKKMNNPFEYCDIVTTTVQKMLRGPKAALIFYKKEKDGKNIEQLINKSVFPATQGGPHNQTIAGIATALKFAKSDEYKKFIDDILKNIQIFVEVFKKNKVKMLCNGTKNHLILADMRNLEFDGEKYSLSGSMVASVLDFVGISLNKNSLPDDKSAVDPNGIRIGTPSITSRGFKEEDVKKVAETIVGILKYLKKYKDLKEKE